jgi:hypothetical protein
MSARSAVSNGPRSTWFYVTSLLDGVYRMPSRQTQQSLADANAFHVAVGDDLFGPEREARAARAAGKATFDDRAVLTLHFAATQQ